MLRFCSCRYQSLISLFAALVVTCLAPASAPAAPASLCKGSTRAHVRITWPAAAQRRLHFGAHVPERIRRWAYLFGPDARTAGVDPYLVAGVMRIESNGDPLVWNLDSNAHGLMQVLGASFEPAVNIQVGVRMLAGFLHEFGRSDLALAAYNAGPGAVQQYGGIPPYPETESYVIMVRYWRDLYAGEHLSAARTAQYQQAERSVEAFYKRVCGR